MLFTYRSMDRPERRALDRVAQMRHDLRHFVVENPRHWTGLLARMTRARALRASNSIEGINVSAEDALAAVDGEEREEADKPTWQAIVGYQTAMDFVLQRCRNPHFQFSEDFILAIHFMISQHDPSANPGNYRRGWVGVRNTATGELVHEGVDRDQLESLMQELMEYMNADQESVMLKGAMAHLNLTMIHPFSDGNGRTARCLQTAVLAKEGIVAPIFSSIEEYIGHNQQAYYDVLAVTGGGGWNPQRNCKEWIRFCITGHYRQAQTLLRRTREIERVYDELSREVTRHGLHERTALALLEAAIPSRVRNASYRVSADVSNNLASRDLKELVDIGLLIPRGEKRGRHYIAGNKVMEIRQKHRLPKPDDDPFTLEDEEAKDSQPSLF
ncbi:MAG: Fic family protein [Bradyrhizobiaceae bacterium]|nr:Fic family protein [Bradyrhizobiaceae bacterium]